MAFDTRKQSIPQAFIDKMKIDDEISDMKASPVVFFNEAKEALIERNRIRGRCAAIIRQTTTTPIGPGSPGAGTVFKPQNLQAVA